MACAIGLGSSVFNIFFFLFHRQTLFEFDSKAASKDDDLYHFVSYVPINGRVYELDGLKAGPVDLGAIPSGKDWLDVAQPLISQRIKK